MATAELIETLEITSGTEASTLTITVPTTYDDLRIFGALRTNYVHVAYDDLGFLFDDGTGASFTNNQMELSSTTLIANIGSSAGSGYVQVRATAGGTAAAGFFTPFECFIPNYSRTDNKKQAWYYQSLINDTSVTYYRQMSKACMNNQTSAITRLEWRTNGAEVFKEHSVISVYGITNDA